MKLLSLNLNLMKFKFLKMLLWRVHDFVWIGRN